MAIALNNLILQFYLSGARAPGYPGDIGEMEGVAGALYPVGKDVL